MSDKTCLININTPELTMQSSIMVVGNIESIESTNNIIQYQTIESKELGKDEYIDVIEKKISVSLDVSDSYPLISDINEFNPDLNFQGNFNHTILLRNTSECIDFTDYSEGEEVIFGLNIIESDVDVQSYIKLNSEGLTQIDPILISPAGLVQNNMSFLELVDKRIGSSQLSEILINSEPSTIESTNSDLPNFTPIYIIVFLLLVISIIAFGLFITKINKNNK